MKKENKPTKTPKEITPEEKEKQEKTAQFLSEVGKRIAAKRKELHITQEEFAEKVDTSAATIVDIEKGTQKKGCNIELFSKIASELDTSADSLLGLDKTKDTATLTDRQKLNIIKDFINLVKPKFDIIGNTIDEVRHYKACLIINDEILTAYLKAYYDITNVKVSNASAATMDKVNNLLLNDFNEFMQKAITFKDNTMLLTDDYEIRDNEIIEVVPF